MTRSGSSVKCVEPNTSNFPENFSAFTKNFLAFAKYFLDGYGSAQDADTNVNSFRQTLLPR